MQMKDPLTLNGLICPVEILQLITTATQAYGIARGAAPGSLELWDAGTTTRNLRSNLARILTFDVSFWARNVSQATSLMRHIPHTALAQVCQVWKVAAAIYVSRILYNLTKDRQYLLPAVEDLIAAFEDVQDDTQLNYLTWPTFIVGVTSTKPAHRQWTLSTLDKIWRRMLCANVKGAELVVGKLWEKQDLHRRVEGSQLEDWDWICELSRFDRYWIFF